MDIQTRKTFDSVLAGLAAEVDAFAWEDRQAYAMWLRQTYAYVRYSTRILALAAARFSPDEDAMHQRFLSHIREENRHEKLAERDLAALGADLKSLPELPATSGFYRSQYFWLTQDDPSSLFGWILALEGVAVLRGKEIHGRVKRAFGDAAASFLKVHSEEDPGHLEQALRSVGTLDPKRLHSVERNLVESSGLYIRVLRDSAQGGVGTGRKAAV